MMDDTIDNCDYEPTGINAQFGYNTQLDNDGNMCCCKKMDEIGSQMLDEIRNLEFAITDISQYLNTHPNDEKALCLHTEYCTKWHSLQAKYQKVYGPLSIKCPCNKWRWLEEPWPWERSEE